MCLQLRFAWSDWATWFKIRDFWCVSVYKSWDAASNVVVPKGHLKRCKSVSVHSYIVLLFGSSATHSPAIVTLSDITGIYQRLQKREGSIDIFEYHRLTWILFPNLTILHSRCSARSSWFPGPVIKKTPQYGPKMKWHDPTLNRDFYQRQFIWFAEGKGVKTHEIFLEEIDRSRRPFSQGNGGAVWCRWPFYLCQTPDEVSTGSWAKPLVWDPELGSRCGTKILVGWFSFLGKKTQQNQVKIPWLYDKSALNSYVCTVCKTSPRCAWGFQKGSRDHTWPDWRLAQIIRSQNSMIIHINVHVIYIYICI